MILLTCAVARELAFWETRAGVDVLVAGVGPVEAAVSVAHVLAQQRYKLVVNAGIGGAFDGAAAVGDAVVVARDRLELDYETGAPIALPDGEPIADEAVSDPLLVTRMTEHGFARVSGITVSRITATEETAQRLIALGAQVESMEGFAVLRAAQRAGIPAIQLRGISNRCGSQDRSSWNFDAGFDAVRRITEALFEGLDAAHRTGAP